MFRGSCPVFSHPSWVVSLVLQNLIGTLWSSYGQPKCVFWFCKCSSSWPLPRLGVLVYSLLCHFVAFIPGAGVRCSFLSTQALWRRLGTPPPLLLGLRASLYRSNQSRDNRLGDCYILCGRSGVTWTALLRIVSDASGFFLLGVARMSYRRPLSPSGSGCRCHEYSGSRLRDGLFVSLELGALVLALRLFFEKNFAVILVGGRVLYVTLAHILVVCYLAVAPRFLAAFHRACVVAVPALVLPGPARLDISLLTAW